jgi:hypothetical protein
MLQRLTCRGFDTSRISASGLTDDSWMSIFIRVICFRILHGAFAGYSFFRRPIQKDDPFSQSVERPTLVPPVLHHSCLETLREWMRFELVNHADSLHLRLRLGAGERLFSGVHKDAYKRFLALMCHPTGTNIGARCPLVCR